MDLSAWFDGQIGELQEAKGQYSADLEAKKQEGFIEGQNSIILPAPNDPSIQYTQEQMDALAVQVRAEKDAEYQPQVDELGAQVAALRSSVDALAFEKEQLAAEKVAIVEKVKAFKEAGDQAEAALISDLQV